MTEKNISNLTCLIGGLGVGSLIGILFAPKAGHKTREYLANKAKESRGYAGKQARHLKVRAEGFIERGKEAVAAKKNQIVTAVNVGRDVYRDECEMARKI